MNLPTLLASDGWAAAGGAPGAAGVDCDDVTGGHFLLGQLVDHLGTQVVDLQS